MNAVVKKSAPEAGKWYAMKMLSKRVILDKRMLEEVLRELALLKEVRACGPFPLLPRRSIHSHTHTHIPNTQSLEPQIHHHDQVRGSRFVCSAYYAFQDDERLYLVLDLYLGGDLRFHLSKAPHGRMTPQQVRTYMRAWG